MQPFAQQGDGKSCCSTRDGKNEDCEYLAALEATFRSLVCEAGSAGSHTFGYSKSETIYLADGPFTILSKYYAGRLQDMDTIAGIRSHTEVFGQIMMQAFRVFKSDDRWYSHISPKWDTDAHAT